MVIGVTVGLGTIASAQIRSGGKLIDLARMATVAIKVEFSGGMELLFNNVREHTVTLPANSPNDSSKPTNLQDLIFYIRDNMMTDKKDLFVDKDTVRPGILVLVNNVDWELCDELDYELQDKDEIVFISTLHGG